MKSLHALELFYYVARHGGISRAIRHIPHGISQPAVSMQISRLEESLGCTLFQRRPFELTPVGAAMFECVNEFQDRVDRVLKQFCAPGPKVVRLASTPLILREYLRPILVRLRRRFPELLFCLLEGSQREIDRWFEDGEVDGIINAFEGRGPAGCRVVKLIEVPIILLVPLSSPCKSLADLINPKSGRVHLVGFRSDDSIMRGFKQGLSCWPAHWVTVIQSNSIEMVEGQARDGHGIAVTVQVPGRKLPPGVRALSLPGFPRLTIGAAWRGPRNDTNEALLAELKDAVRRL